MDNKSMMKKIIISLLAGLLAISASAQFNDAGRYTPYSAFGVRYRAGAFDSILLIPVKQNVNPPNSFRAGSIRYNAATEAIEIYNGISWLSVQGGTGTGEANTASNAGTGVGFYKTKVGAELIFKSLIVDGTLSLSAGTNENTLKVDTSKMATRFAVSGLSRAAFTAGAGISIVNGVITNTAKNDGSATIIIPGQNNLSVTGQGTINQPYQINVKNFTDSIYLKTGTDSVFTVIGGVPRYTFRIVGGSGGEANSGQNVGTGAGIFKAKTGLDLQFKSITAGTGVAVTANTNDVNVAIDPAAVVTPSRLNDTAAAIRASIGSGGVGVETDPTIPVGTASQYLRGNKTLATLDKSAVGLSSVDNTADVNKPVSTAQAAAIATKEPLITAGTIGDYRRGDKTWQPLNKAAVGLSAVDNTSDAGKPLSTAAVAALAAKANTSAIAQVGFTGNYNDLLNRPSIPPGQVNADWNAPSGPAQILNKPVIPTDNSQLANGAGYVTGSRLNDSTAAIRAAKEDRLTFSTGLTRTVNAAKVDTTMMATRWYVQQNSPANGVTSFNGRTGPVVPSAADYTTTIVPEGTNKYYLDSRARAALIAGAGISYNSTTGQISSTFTQADGSETKVNAGSNITITGLGTIGSPYIITGVSDNWGSQVVQHDPTMTGNGTLAQPLKNDTATYIATRSLIRDSSNSLRAAIPSLARASLSAGTGIIITPGGLISSSITQADGSETKLAAGTNVSITGSGTTASPYIINSAGSSGTGTVPDNWGTQIVEHDNTLTGSGTNPSPLKADTTKLATRAFVLNQPSATWGYIAPGAGLQAQADLWAALQARSLTGHTHNANTIITDNSNRFITDAERLIWNDKQNALGYTPVPNTVTINSKQLNTNINITKADIGLPAVPNIDATLRSNHTGTQPISTLSDFPSQAGQAGKSLSTNGTSLTWVAPVTGVATFNGRTGAVVPGPGDYSFAMLGLKPTTLGGYGITDAEGRITATSVNDYFRGDKTFQPLNKAAVGLGLVDNTPDLGKPISTSQQTALNLKANQTALVDTAAAIRSAIPVSTSQLPEGVNKYYSDDRARSVFTAGTNVTISADGVISAAGSSGVPGVTSFNNRAGAVIPQLGDYSFNQISGKPTTRAGYGITDAEAFLSFSNGLNRNSNVIQADTNFLATQNKLRDTAAVLRTFIRAETDPTVPSHVKSISSGQIANWNTAYGWGNHAGLYPLMTGSYTNPAWIQSLPYSKITGAPAQVTSTSQLINNSGFLTGEADPLFTAADANLVKINGSYGNPTWLTSLAWGKITGAPAFLTSYTETDPLAVKLAGSYVNPTWISSLPWSKITGAPGFLTSYTETDPLAVKLAGSYVNPSWLVSIPATKITGLTSDAVTEGTTNLFYTTARARSAFSAGTNITITNGVISATGSGGATIEADPIFAADSSTIVRTSRSYANPAWIPSLAWSKITGAPSFLTTESDPLAVKLAGSYTNPSWLVSIPSSKVTSLTTDAVTEGTNQYFTTARARSSFSAGTNITITNGVISAVGSGGTPIEGDPVYQADTMVVKKNQSYSNPAWITSLVSSKIALPYQFGTTHWGTSGLRPVLYNSGGVITASDFYVDPTNHIVQFASGGGETSGAYSVNFGTGNATKNGSKVFGAGNYIDNGSIALGNANNATGLRTVTIGQDLENYALGTVVVGQYNLRQLAHLSWPAQQPVSSSTTHVPTDPIFIVGNGSHGLTDFYNGASGDFSNALEILKNGNSTFYGDVKTTTGFVFPDGTRQITAAGGNGGGGGITTETDPLAVKLAGSYTNPSWLVSLPASKITGQNTDLITEGSSNLFFSQARARAAFTAGTNITITNGVISSTGSGGVGAEADPVYQADSSTIVRTNRSYTNPSWLSSIDYSKITNGPPQYWQVAASGGIKWGAFSDAGTWSFASGTSNQGDGSQGAMIGLNNEIYQVGNVAMGRYNVVGAPSYDPQQNIHTASSSQAFGEQNMTLSSYSFTQGYHNVNRSYGSFMGGTNAPDYPSANGQSPVATDPIFVIGNGTSNAARSAAIEVFRNGNAKIQGMLSVGAGITFADGTVQTTAGSGGGSSDGNNFTTGVTFSGTTLTTTRNGIADPILTTIPVPTAVSQLSNDLGFVNVNHLHTISDVTGLQAALNGKQSTLTAGSNITIVDGVISSTASGGGTAGVTSFNGRDGAVTATKTDVGLGNVQNVDQTNASNLQSGTIPASRIGNFSIGLNKLGAGGFRNDQTVLFGDYNFKPINNQYISYTGMSTGAGNLVIGVIPTGEQGASPESGIYEFAVSGNNYASGGTDIFLATVLVNYGNPTGATVQVKTSTIQTGYSRTGVLSNGYFSVTAVGRNLELNVSALNASAGNINWQVNAVSKVKQLIAF